MAMGIGQRRAGWGFSLVELSLVLSIVAVFAAVAVPRYATSVVRYRADAAARRIVADLGLARAKARESSEGKTVIFDTAAGRLTIPGIRGLDGSLSAHTTDLSAEPYRVRLVSADFGGDSEVVLDGYGVPDSGGTAVIGLGDVLKTVVLDEHSGEARVQ